MVACILYSFVSRFVRSRRPHRSNEQASLNDRAKGEIPIATVCGAQWFTIRSKSVCRMIVGSLV
jgi:hypothetical protein